MINFQALEILGDRDLISDDALRLFIRLLRDYDLSRYKAIPLRTIREYYRITRQEAIERLADLTSSGLLELGPKLGRAPTYRVGRKFLLAPDDARNWFHSLEVLDGMRELVPPRASG